MTDVVRHELRVRSLRIVRVTPLVAGFARVSMAGRELDGFSAPGPGDHVKLTIPSGDGTVRRDLTPVTEPGRDEEVLHLDIATAHDGPLTRWVAAAAVGDTVTIGGPRASRLPPVDVSGALLVVDASAFAVGARWLTVLGNHPDAPIHAVSFGPEDFAAYLAAYPDRAARDAFARARHDANLAPEPEAVAALLRQRSAVAGERAILAGEASVVASARRVLRREFDVPTDRVNASGYWKAGVAEYDHHAPLDGDSDDAAHH